MTSAPRLGAAGIHRLQRQLSPRDWAVIRDVDRFRLMTGRQLQQLHVGEGEPAARASRRLLLSLTRRRVLVRLPRQVGGLRAGSSGFVYALGPVGDRLLHAGGPRRRVRDVGDGFLAHTLAIADLFVSLTSAERRGEVEVLGLAPEPQCWRRLDLLGGAEWLKPDLHVVLAVGEEELHSFVEVDRGSEHNPALLRKLRQYEAAYRSGQSEHQDGVFPRVVWLVPDERRAAQLRRLVTGSGALTAELHAVGLQSQALNLLGGRLA